MKIKNNSTKKKSSRKLDDYSNAKLTKQILGVVESKMVDADRHAFGSHSDPIGKMSKGEMLPRFASALKHPFGPDANGIRVPDPYAWPTTTAKLMGRMTIGSDAYGRAHRLFLPNPIISSASFLGTYSVNSQVPFTSTPYASRACTGLSLSNMFSSYRVASWGVKISNLQPMVSATGRVIVSLVPTSNKHLTENIIDSQGLGTNEFSLWNVGLPDSALYSGAQLNLPCAMECTVQDLFNGSLEVGCPVVHPKFFEFRSCGLASSIQSGSYSVVGEGGAQVLLNATTGVPIVGSAGTSDSTDMGGGCAVNFYFEGLPISTQAIFDVEYVYHLEGTPVLASTSGAVPTPSGQKTVVHGSRDIVDKAIASNSGLHAITWIDKAADFMTVAAPVAAAVNPYAGAVAGAISAALQALR